MHLDEFEWGALRPGMTLTAWAKVAPRANGNMWQLPILAMRGETDGPVLVVLAGVHGDEYTGIEAIHRTIHELTPQALCGTLIMVPVSNPSAYEGVQRNSLEDGANLARVFPGKADGTVTERIADWITRTLLARADFLLDFHTGGTYADIPTLIGYIHDESELGQRSQAAARAFGVPVMWGHPLPLAPGRSLSAATDLGVPCLYTEAPGGGYAEPEVVACFQRGLKNLMRHLSMLDGTPETVPVTHHLLGDGNLDFGINAPAPGYFRAAVNLLESVEAGQLLATIYDAFGNPSAEITAPHAGVVIMLRRFHFVHVGERVIHLTQFA